MCIYVHLHLRHKPQKRGRTELEAWIHLRNTGEVRSHRGFRSASDLQKSQSREQHEKQSICHNQKRCKNPRLYYSTPHIQKDWQEKLLNKNTILESQNQS